MIQRYPEVFPGFSGRYIEPFLGGGAVFFSLCPQRATLADINQDLINSYRAIRDDWKGVYRLLQQHQTKHSPERYYAVRERDEADSIASAARFIYLNRTCFNGLYRVNRQGKFNVPIGTKIQVLFDSDRFDMVSKRLRRARLRVRSFEATMAEAGEGDFIFADPPYTVRHNLNGFIKYNHQLFSWNDQTALRDSTLGAAERGAKVLVMNANHESIRELYRGIGTAIVVQRSSVIAGSLRKRGVVEELAIQVW